MPESSGRFAAVGNNLTLLQDVIRRDPFSYRDEFEQQLENFEDQIRLIELQPNFAENSVDVATVSEVLAFLTATSPAYPEAVSVLFLL